MLPNAKKAKSLLMLFSLSAGLFTSFPSKSVEAASSNLTLTSGSKLLQDSFEWAKNRALGMDVTTDNIQAVRESIGCMQAGGCEDPRVKDKYAVKPLIPAYWGSYTNREAFCDRDIAHQSAAGHLLNMDEQTFSMLRTFAKGANNNPANPYWPKWSYDFMGDPYYMDSDWRELPVPFEIVQKAYEQYLWTGDTKWINDPELLTYYENIHTNFMNLQDEDHNGVADETKQLATYWEDVNLKLFEAGDSIGSQYQALVSYAKILEARGDMANAAVYEQKAAALRNYFEANWYSDADGRYIRAFHYDANHNKVGLTSWGHENSIFMPLKLITDQGPKTAEYLNFIHQSVVQQPLGIEATTYLPELFYMHGENDKAWQWHVNVMNSRNTYPEVSFMIVSNTINGLMGVRPDAPNHTVYTVPRLVNDVPWVQADHVRIGGNDLTVRHDGNNKTTLKNNAGESMTWEAQFYGNYNELIVNGNRVPASHKDLNGKAISYVSVPVQSGSEAIVKVPGVISNFSDYVSDLNWVSATTDSGVVQKDKNYGGNLIKLNGKTYTKGISAHAKSQVVYNLNGQYQSFTAEVGIDDDVQDQGPSTVVFQVYGDGVKLFDSGVMTPTSPTQLVNVSVANVNELKLVATDGGDGINSDHADWADAKLIYPWHYVSDGYPISTTVGYRTVADDKSVDQHPLKLQGTTYGKGLGTHANSEIVYELNGQYKRFTSIVGVDDEVGPYGTVVFQVFVDGVKQYDSGLMVGGGSPGKVDVDLSGASQLKLVVTDGGDNMTNDHADWAEVKLYR
ncbi:NPCBM/NEW2 domain-containing protein [Paenibacillus sp. N1-5-1-14]|uniref:NPCBM/NEW2 domain-containing protein n=1 Tax=Paenibacillus radicibacter TaxID=2972488 RepID=UPI0021595A9A|nr:NPCBM/NEW2 domain-containing protein [Paenibacillus radicibacter]MCR8644798.1 NPCBM/NEW2 domain-containing protein [Paenibacillus radicibacter]